jgi:hypothetical protein
MEDMMVDGNGKGPQFAWTDGRWYLLSLGTFIQGLIDTGQDPAVAVRVVEDDPPDEAGQFVRRLEIVQAPNGHVLDVCRRVGCVATGRVIHAMIEAGKVH